MSGRLGVILGSGAAGLDLGPGVETIDRHGNPYRLPHEIDHVANLQRLRDAGCDRVVGVSSVGGLRRELGPGTMLIPDDFVSLDGGAVTSLLGDAQAHRVPAFDSQLRAALVAGLGDGAIDGGVYWQVAGPRLETPAEVRFIAQHANVVGMTVASECVIAGEMGVAYAAVCMVDNFANGVVDEELSAEEVRAGQARNREALLEALRGVLPGL